MQVVSNFFIGTSIDSSLLRLTTTALTTYKLLKWKNFKLSEAGLTEL